MLLLGRVWAAFLLAQIAFELVWSGLSAGAEWALGLGRLEWSWGLALALLFIAIGPALLVYRRAVSGFPGRAAAPVPRVGIFADRGRDLGVGVAALNPSGQVD
jgi:hypothetical protein